MQFFKIFTKPLFLGTQEHLNKVNDFNMKEIAIFIQDHFNNELKMFAIMCEDGDAAHLSIFFKVEFQKFKLFLQRKKNLTRQLHE
jgi:hypothetical protein